MKKIINGKVYDTETAKECGRYSNGGTWRDFEHYTEALYRKRTGEFFLHGEGGPMTKYAVNIDANNWSGGERIMPMSFSEARQWAEDHLDGEGYEAIFGPVPEDDSKRTVGFSISASAAETIKRRAAELGISASEYVERLISADG